MEQYICIHFYLSNFSLDFYKAVKGEFMIKTLYEKFQSWSAKGSVYIISDTHFEDHDCKIMDPNWITPEEHINIIKKSCHKNDTLIHLGDVGNPEWLKQVKSYKVLIMGNHDQSIERFRPYFDEIYQGPLFISEKILLSHEPVLSDMWMNIHGHDHSKSNKSGKYERNLASNVTGFKVFNLGNEIKNGLISNVKGVHRETIDNATERKNKRDKN